jgi:alpha-L-rhamnosidase
MNSFNHYADGAVGDWMVSTVAGLQFDPAQPGYRHIVFKPRPGGTLTWAEARLKTPHGETSIRWELKDAALVLELVVPAGATASLDLPSAWDSPCPTLGAGTHHLSLQSAFSNKQDQRIGRNVIPTHVATDEAILVKQ